MNKAKILFKRNSHNRFVGTLAGFGRALNRYYENRNHDKASNGELTVIRKMARLEPAVVIDGGANLGEYSRLFNQYSPGTTIWAFEPVESTFMQLQKRVAGHENIHAIHKGLYSEGCSREIHIMEPSTHSTIYDLKNARHRTGHKEFIDLVRGDDFLEREGIKKVDFLKLDLEGAEYDALVGFGEAFRRKRIRVVQFEYGNINISTRKLLVDFYEFFVRHGYRIGKIYPKRVVFRPYDFRYEDFLGPNHIAVDETETALISMLEKR
jgi:FkbM family methyltransferase